MDLKEKIMADAAHTNKALKAHIHRHLIDLYGAGYVGAIAKRANVGAQAVRNWLRGDSVNTRYEEAALSLVTELRRERLAKMEQLINPNRTDHGDK